MFVNGCFDTSYNLFIFGLLRKAMIFYFKINMEQSFENGKYYDVFMNEINMEDEPLQEVKKMQVSK
jgi:hypothetical protein